MSVWSPSEHERLFVSAFVRKDRRERAFDALEHPQRRTKWLDRLNHRDDIAVSDSTIRIASPGEALKSLQARGAGPEAYLLACASDKDGAVLPLGEAVEFLFFHGFGSVVSSIPGRLALFRAEAPGPAFLLERP